MKKSIFHAAAEAGALLTITTFWGSRSFRSCFSGKTPWRRSNTPSLNTDWSFWLPSYGFCRFIGFFPWERKKRPDHRCQEKAHADHRPQWSFHYDSFGAPPWPQGVPCTVRIWFYAVQVLELLVGLVQIMLLSMNFKDGLRLTGKLPRWNGNASSP